MKTRKQGVTDSAPSLGKCLATLATVLTIAGSVFSSELQPDLRNPLWKNLPVPTGPSETPGQFGGAGTSASAGAVNPSSISPELNQNFQSSETKILTRSIIGSSFSGSIPDYFIGNIIAQPTLTFLDSNAIEVPLRREPLAPGETVTYRDEDGIKRDFTYLSSEGFSPFYWSPHKELSVIVDSNSKPVGENEQIASESDLARTMNGAVFASEPGRVEIYWRTDRPIEVEQGSPIYGLTKRTITVSAGTSQPTRKIFWTEAGFTGPTVSIPKGAVQQVKVVYNRLVPETVADEDIFEPEGATGSNDENEVPLPNRTLWYDNSLGELKAYNKEGRVLIEYLGVVKDSGQPDVREHIGIEIVDIVREARPFNVTTSLGERLLPSSDGRTVIDQPDKLDALEPTQVLNAQNLSVQYVRTFILRNKTALFAEAVTRYQSDVQVYWKESGIEGILWPRFLNTYELVWPDNIDQYAVNVRPSDADSIVATLPILPDNGSKELISQDDPEGLQASFNDELRFEVVVDPSDPTNRSLVLIQSGSKFWYVRVESVLDKEVEANARYANYRYLVDSEEIELTAKVGVRIPSPPSADTSAGYIDASKGSAYNVNAYIDPFQSGILDAELGAIIPVNAAESKNGAPNDELVVWWFKKITPPSTAGDEFEPIYWPSILSRYQLVWPEEPQQIVLAEGKGSGELPPEAAAGSLYVQNDPLEDGYNPNEEHALFISETIYALRDDLNAEGSTSSPFVLFDYTANDGRPNMLVYKVVRETDDIKFEYNAIAGKPLLPPAPLSLLPPPIDADGTTRNAETTASSVDPAINPPAEGLPASYENYNQFTVEDRKGLKWLYRGPHNLASGQDRPKLTMQWYYNTLPGFSFPNPTTGEDAAPEVGTIVPFLRPLNPDSEFIGDPISGDSLDITYLPYWPDEDALAEEERSEMPVLQFAETLAQSKFGLPGLIDQSSVQVLYQQSVAKDVATNKQSAVLHDSVRRKITPLEEGQLDAFAGSSQTNRYQGNIFFQNLPPHIQERFFLDPREGEFGALVLEGEFVEELVGESYLLLNTLSATEVDTLKQLVDPSNTNKADWDAAIDALSTSLETFALDPLSPLGYSQIGDADVGYGINELAEIVDEDSAVASYALTAVGGGDGYLTLFAGNGEVFTDPSEPIEMYIIKVGDALYRGEVKPVVPANPLGEQITLLHTGDFAAQSQDFEFQWRYSPPVDGQPPAVSPGESGSTWKPLDSDGAKAVFGGGSQPLLTMSDNYVTVRYRPLAGHALYPSGGYASDNVGWSDWTDAALAEGWIKRVLAGINPFNQRVTDFFNNTVNTDTSLLTQAGHRWEGDVPLNLEAVEDAGLIEIYETVLKRGISFSIDGNPAVDYGPANDALLLAAGYLSDLYMALGNEALADASNPTIIFDRTSQALEGQSRVNEDFFKATSTSRFAFEGQVPNLLEEELTLLRGRDDFFAPGVSTAPVYNRLFWNYTRGIDAGEVFYALNYNIREKTDDNADGKIDAADALRQYPQGHGDAYGHYLTSLKNYYRLLSDEQFTWTPRIEAVNILGKPVTVDYVDERKFTRSAAALADATAQIINLEHRRIYHESPESGWSNLRDERENTSTGVTRRWGLEEWASRGGQSTYINWAVANAILPEEDTENEGVQKIDRTTVPELDELALTMEQLQNAMDAANARVNPLGLTPGSLVFDIDPSRVEDGETYFEQIYERAATALANASTVFEKATDSTRLLRSVENQTDNISKIAFDQEFAFNVKLIDILGTPYAGDKGPGKLYDQDYDGPDTEKYMFIDTPDGFQQRFGNSETFTFELPSSTLTDTVIEADGDNFSYLDNFSDLFSTRIDLDSASVEKDQLEDLRDLVAGDGSIASEYTINPENLVQFVAPGSMGRRTKSGKVQEALLRYNNARDKIFHAYEYSENQRAVLESKLTLYEETIRYHENYENVFKNSNRARLEALGVKQASVLTRQLIQNREAIKNKISEAISDGLPKSVGFSNDVTSAARFAARLASLTLTTILKAVEYGTYVTEFGAEKKLEQITKNLPIALQQSGFGVETVRVATEFVDAYKAYAATTQELNSAATEMASAANKYYALLADADRIMTEREIFRKRVAAVAQGYRTRDVAFRAFRTEALEEYQSLLDWAARYTFLAAKAYDYETGLLSSESGQDYLNEIVASRALGIVGENGEPQFAGSDGGDPGLSSLLAKLKADWDVVEGRLGFNNPDTYGTTFSMRREHFRLPYAENGEEESHLEWREKLQSLVVDDLRSDADVAAYALQMSDSVGSAVPGIIISFSTSIEDGLNFFGRSLIAGDSQFTPTNFATKIYSVGVVLDGYQGMPPCTICGHGSSDVTHNHPDALSATPYVYLIPAGRDVMRTPALGDTDQLRTWKVHDNALPLPYNIGQSEYSDNEFWTGSSSLSEDFFTSRKHQAFRATDHADFFFTAFSDDYTNTRLIGRSVWNTEWKLVIPANTLLAETEEGIDRFIRSVKDIKIFLRTYSHAGN